MTASWVIGDSGSGEQLTSVTAGSVSVSLAERELIEVRMVSKGADTVSATWTSADCSAVTTASSITYTHAEGSEIALTLAQSGTGDSVLVTPSVTLGGAHASGYAVDSIDVRLAIDCSGSTWRLRWPELGGEVVPDASDASTESFMYPSFSSMTEGVHGHAFTHVYDTESGNEGLWLGTTDAAMRGKAFGRSSADSVLYLRLRLFPEDNRATTAFAWPYAVELAPMAGDWYDADDLYRRRMIAAGLPSMATTLKAANPAAVSATDVFAYHFTGEPVDSSQVVTDIEDAIDLLGIEPERMVVQLYRWHALPIGDTWPDDQFPPRSGAAALVTALKALGVRVVLYTIQDVAHTTSASYTSEGWSSELIETGAGTPRYRILGGYTEPADGLHTNLDLVDNAVRLERQGSWLTDLRAEFDTDFDGTYLDAHGAGWSIFNHRSTLAASQRGPGSTTGATVTRAHLADTRAAWRSDQADSVTVTEHANDLVIGACDFTSDQGFSYFAPDVTRRTISVTPNIYSERQRIINFEAFGSIEDQTIFGLRGWPWFESWRWHDGWLGSLGFQQGIKDARPAASDPRRATWDTYMAPAWEFWRRMHVGLATACHRFHTGRRLRPLASSHEEDVIANGYAYELLTDPESGALSYGITTMQRAHSSVWLDTDTGALGVFLSNWHPTEDASQPVALTTTTHPDLPSGLLRLVQVDPDTGAEEIVDHFQASAGWHQTLTLTPREVRHLRIEQALNTTQGSQGGTVATTRTIVGSVAGARSVSGAAAATTTVSGAWAPTGSI